MSTRYTVRDWRNDRSALSVPWPVDDEKHRWWLVPQNMSQDEYVTYWRMEWGHDAKPYGII